MVIVIVVTLVVVAAIFFRAKFPSTRKSWSPARLCGSLRLLRLTGAIRVFRVSSNRQ
jgi:hypothetical protein